MASLQVSFAQQTVTKFQDNFENGSSQWNLGANSGLTDAWVVDTNYQGAVMDLGLFQIPIFPNSPNQPSVYSGSPRSSYLHITNPLMCSMMNYCNASYSSTGEFNAVISQPVDFTGFENVNVKFGYFAGGDVDSAYAYFQYSLDSISWTTVGNKLVNQSDWTDFSASIPILTNANRAYFRLHWFNLGASEGNFSIGVDELVISARSIQTNFFTSSTPTVSTLCANTASNISINFTTTGTFTSGNVYELYISDAQGSFTNQQLVGSLTSVDNNNLNISGSVNLSVGTNYQLKLVSTAPNVEEVLAGTYTVNALPQLTVTSNSTTNQISAGQSIVLVASGAASYSWSPTTGVDNPIGNIVTLTPNITTSYTVVGTSAEGCSSSEVITITVVSNVGLSNEKIELVTLYPNPSEHGFMFSNSEVEISSIYSVDGKLVNNYTFENGVLSFDNAGIYFVNFQLNNQTLTIKCVKK